MGWLHWRHLPLSTPHPPQVEKVTLVYQVGIATANLQIELPEFVPKNLPEWAE